MSLSDAEKLDALFLHYLEDLRRFVRSKTGNNDITADLVQDTFLALKESAHPNLQNPKAFIFTIAANLSVDWIRKSKRRAIEDGSEATLHNLKDPSISPLDAAVTREMIAVVIEAIDGLPSRCRQVFLMNKFEHKSHQEIANQLNISVSMVEKHIFRALKALRDGLSKIK